MDRAAAQCRLEEVERTGRARGDESRLLRIGDWRFRIAGLDAALAEALERRWGGFLVPDLGLTPLLTVELLDAGEQGWLTFQRGEVYRLEAGFERGSRPLVYSYNFAARPDDADAGVWHVALSRSAEEPAERTVENVVRYLVARTAVGQGGIALHAAGMLRGGRAYLFAGTSRAGKSTVVRLSAGIADSLGDDFALTVPAERGWVSPAVPFDNSERAAVDPPSGWFPLHSIWRLHQAVGPSVELPAAFLARASLTSCAAFPHAMQDLSGSILQHVEQLVADGRFGHLHFDRSADFWARIDAIP